ncbi:MAG: DUF4445 domain-containing protein [Crenarchaeota archaeon]|nr:DUF4445 domain-containing protein [Thermoproteota archaeon]
MHNNKVVVEIEGYGKITAKKGEVLGNILERKGLINLPCHGQGLCGLCRVIVIVNGLSKPTEREQVVLGEALGEQRLACQARILDYTRIRLPGEKLIEVTGKDYLLPRLTCIEPIVKALTINGSSPADAELIIASQSIVDGRYSVKLHDKIVSLKRYEPRNLLLVDMGTTTITVVKTGLDGRVVSGLTLLNPLYKYGLDVISRGEKAVENPLLAAEMKKLILDTLTKLSDEYTALIIGAGNTINTFIAAGLPVKSLIEAPYSPGVRGSVLVPVNPPVLLAPVITGQVGGDTLMNILATHHQGYTKPYMVIDIGTNTEIALITEERIYVASAPAGPAIEGYVGRGSWAGRGGIHYVMVRDCGETPCFTIKGDPRRGLMGSGILSLIYGLLRNGYIDPSGRFRRGYKIIGGRKAFVLDEESGLYFTQRDLREVQKAIAAVKAGWKAVLRRAGLGPEELAVAVITGSPVQSLREQVLQGLGLSPCSKVRIVPNIVPYGLYLYAFSEKYRKYAKHVLANAEHVVLAGKQYSDLWIESLSIGPC